MAENNHDFAHFQFVHGTDADPRGDELIDGTYKRIEGPAASCGRRFGLGLGVLRVPAA